jgi:hypothetical protein
MTEGAILHDRATRGEVLTESEQALLEDWYREQDEAEAALLAANRPSIGSDAMPTDLQTILARIRETTVSIEALHQQNTTLREEIAALQKRLAPRAA